MLFIEFCHHHDAFLTWLASFEHHLNLNLWSTLRMRQSILGNRLPRTSLQSILGRCQGDLGCWDVLRSAEMCWDVLSADCCHLRHQENPHPPGMTSLIMRCGGWSIHLLMCVVVINRSVFLEPAPDLRILSQHPQTWTANTSNKIDAVDSIIKCWWWYSDAAAAW